MASFQSQTVRLDERDDGIATARIDVPDRSLNVLSRQLRADLRAVFDHVAAHLTIKLLALRSDKSSGFLAGADIQEFMTIQGKEMARSMSADGQDLFTKLAALRIPTIAMIHGPCVGGGLELALACDYRLVVDSPKTQLGFPEIELGLLPAWGGCQRLPRVVGLERALQVILNRRRLNARQALRWGLADAIATTEADLTSRLSQLIDRALREGKKASGVASAPRARLPLRTWRQRLLESNPIGRHLLFRGTERILHRRVPDDMPAPFEALDAIRAGLTKGMEAGLAREREGAARLSTSHASRNLVTLFFQTEQARKLPDPQTEGQPQVRRIGIVGAGVMGAGIAQLAAMRGCDVAIQEINEAALATGMRRIRELFDKAAEKGVLSASKAQQTLSSIRRTVSWEGFGQLDLVIEAVVEDLAIKQKVFRELTQRTRPSTILATNTSSLQVGNLTGAVPDAGRLAGLHFFNPVHKMPLVEIVRLESTSNQVLSQLRQWTIDVGKVPVVVRDSPGFVVNRVLGPYLDEATRLAGEELPIGQIDRVMRRFGMPMGPFELLDQVGLDVAAHVARSMEPAAKGRFSPNAVFQQMVERGWLGEKAGAGFYHYRGKKKKVNSEAVGLLQNAAGDSTNVLGPAIPVEVRVQEARERMVLLMVNEAAMCLEERLAEDVSTIDLAMVLGTGWAPHRGGPLRYALDRGIDKVAQALYELAKHYGTRFEPCDGLKHLA
jgi:3-hydroxyacyl-CoA dehydrogenase/enoyl-CoA hydratase/3-hydroxybutyryl-CoA epimerase